MKFISERSNIKFDKGNEMTRQNTRLLAAIALSGLLIACGGGSGGSPASPTTMSGAVMDGYLTGSNICLDINANLLCDSGEPTATSKDKGAYSLSFPAGTDISKLHIIAVIGASTVDADTGIAPPQGYTLIAPATAAGVITPLTTLVSQALIENPGLTLSQAQAQAITNLNLPTGTKFDQDYVAQNNTSAHNIAKLIADVLGQSGISVSDAAAPTSDSEKSASIKVALAQAMTQISAYAYQAAHASDETALQALRTSAKAATKTAIEADTTLAASVRSRAKLGTAQPTNISAILSNSGIFTIWNNYRCYTAAASCLESILYEQVNTNDGTLITVQSYSASNESKPWGIVAPDQTRYVANTTTNNWINQPSSNGMISINSDGLSGKFTNTDTKLSINFSATELDVSGKKASDVETLLKRQNCSAAQICNDFSDFTFPSGSKLFQNNFYRNEAEYSIWDCATCGAYISGSRPTTLDQLISMTNGTSNSQYILFGGGLAKFDPVGNKVFLFDSYAKTLMASGNYQIQTVAGLRVLSINVTSVDAPSMWFGSNGRDKYTLSYIFVERNGKVLIGNKLDAGTSTSLKYLNRTAADAFMAAQNYPATK